MRNFLVSSVAVATVAGAVVPNKFSSGKPVIAQDVNDNFTYLDTNAATKSDVKALQAKQRADSSTLAASASNGLSMAAVNTNLAGLRDTVGKKKDSAWIMKSVTPAAIGALPISNGNASVSGALTVGSMVSAGGFQTGGNLSAKSASIDTIGASGLRFTSPGYQRQVVIGAFDSYSPDSNTHGLYVPALINPSIRFIADASSTTPFLSRSRSDGTWAKDLISVATDGGSNNRLILGGDASVTGAFQASALVNTPLQILNDAQATISVVQQSRSDYTIARNVISVASSGWGVNKVQLGGDLAVSGAISATGTITGGAVVTTAKASDVADYVFEPTYKLSSLSEVEAYTKEHKHLPEVPSATEIERGGLDLAQMNLVLLKKVEELTLHAIEQKKAIEQQRQEMAQVKAELKSLKRD